RAEGLSTSPGWAVGFFFVPVLNLYFPCRVAQEIWKASDPRTPLDDSSWKYHRGSFLVGLWWTFWLVSSVASNLTASAHFRSETTAAALKASAALGFFANATSILAALLAIRVIHRIQTRQKLKHQRVLAESRSGVFAP